MKILLSLCSIVFFAEMSASDVFADHRPPEAVQVPCEDLPPCKRPNCPGNCYRCVASIQQSPVVHHHHHTTHAYHEAHRLPGIALPKVGINTPIFGICVDAGDIRLPNLPNINLGGGGYGGCGSSGGGFSYGGYGGEDGYYGCQTLYQPGGGSFGGSYGGGYSGGYYNRPIMPSSPPPVPRSAPCYGNRSVTRSHP